MPQPVLLCGKREDSMIFDTSSITIEFKSDNLKQYKGFKIYLSVIGRWPLLDISEEFDHW